MKQSRFLLLVILLSLSGVQGLKATLYTWGSTGGGNWTTTGDWTTGTAAGSTSPNGNGDTATFNTSPGGTITIATRGLNTIDFDTGVGSFTFSTSGGNGFFFASGGGINLLSSITSTNQTETINSNVNAVGSFGISNNAASDILVISGSVTNTKTTAGTVTLVVSGTNTGANTIAGVISSGATDATAILKQGLGTWILSGSNTYTAGTTISAGILVFENGTAFGTHGTVTISATATAQVEGNIAGGSQTLTLTGTGAANATGALENVSGSNSYAGALTVTGSIGTTISSDAGTLTLTGGISNGGHTLTVAGAGNVDITTTAITGTGGLTQAGTGTLVLANSQSYTGATTVNSGTLEVDGSLSGSSAVTVNAGTLSGTGTISGGLTVNAGGVTSPGAGSSTGIMTSDLAYSGSSTANFNVTGAGPGGAKTLSSSLFYSQMAVTGTAGQAGLLIGSGLTLGANSTVSGTETAGQILSGTSTSGVTLKLSISTADYATLVAHATTSYQATGTNSTLDNYFVFTLGSVLATGRFATLDMDVNGVDALGTIFYAGANDRFVADGVGNTIGDVIVDVNGVDQEFALSYTGVAGSNATIGGNDIVLTAIPEPGTWGMILGGFGILIGFRRLRKSRVGRNS